MVKLKWKPDQWGNDISFTLPIIEEEFTEEEIDRSILPLPETVSDSLSVISSLNKEETIEITEKIDKKKLLLVEDNEDLLKVMPIHCPVNTTSSKPPTVKKPLNN